MVMRDRISRGDYLSLARSGLCDLSRIPTVEDSILLAALGGSKTKVAELKRAALKPGRSDTGPILPPYSP
jgi:hypothetical protein